MPRKGGVPENLKNFEPGYDPRRNSNGANAGSQSLKSILDRLLKKQITVEDIDGKKIKVTLKEAIALNIVNTAVTEEDPNIMLKAAKQAFEHTDPITKEVSQTVDMTVNGQNELTAEQTDALIKHLQG